MTQLDEQWFRDKAGKISGSRAAALMAKTPSGAPSAGRANLLVRLAIERIIGTCTASYSNANMRFGIETEPEAIKAYEDYRMVLVRKADFIPHPTLDFVGASPDGLVGEDGGVEVKSRLAEALHFKALRTPQSFYLEYKWQVQTNLATTKRKWWDLVSYAPDFPEHLRLAVIRIAPDPKMIRKFEIECIAADKIVNEYVEWMNQNRSEP